TWSHSRLPMRTLDSMTSAGIDLVEAAYRLPLEESDWLEHVLAAGLSTMPHSLFASGITFAAFTAS
ncbi:MAG: hypothetical protein WBN30_14960, partial [Polyangiales bacterium]